MVAADDFNPPREDDVDIPEIYVQDQCLEIGSQATVQVLWSDARLKLELIAFYVLSD